MNKKTIKLGGRTIPLTKNGTPNLTKLTKPEREVVKKWIAEQNKKKGEIIIKDLEKELQSLGE